ncbi:rod-binding protein [uncultured Desulfovibrio sp.]|nr:rod-binding protein [uncultured Desulfovibrio sp.]
MASAFDSSMMQASLGQSQGRQLELQHKVRGLNESASSRLTPEQKERKLREACQGFESIFIQKMWQQMRATLPQGGLLHSRDEKMWQDMYDQELAKSMASAGGIGLADMMYEQLSRNLVSASRGAAGSAGRTSAFLAEAAPLIPSPEAARATTASAPEKAATPTPTPRAQPVNMYEGYAPVNGVVAEGQAAEAGSQGLSPQPAAVPQPAAAPQLTAAAPQPESRQIQVRPHTRQSGQLSGLQMAQQAQRLAGDKLGNGVRPAMSRRQRRETGDMEPAQTGAFSPAGTPAAMQAAMQQPALFQPAQTVQPLNPAAAQAAQPANAANAAPADSRPEVVRIRYQTNMPEQAQQLRQGLNQDLIRTLNVDAGGKKAGQGIRAYHAQGNQNAAQQVIQPPQTVPLEAAQLQAQAQQQQLNALQGQPAAGQANVAPLTGAQAATQPSQAAAGQGLAPSGIPPLTASQAGMGQVRPSRAGQQEMGDSRLSAEEALIAGVPLS